MMEAASTSETSVNLYHTTRRNNPEDNHLHTIEKSDLTGGRILLNSTWTTTRTICELGDVVLILLEDQGVDGRLGSKWTLGRLVWGGGVGGVDSPGSG
jgi:hypothetical protein